MSGVLDVRRGEECLYAHLEGTDYGVYTLRGELYQGDIVYLVLTSDESGELLASCDYDGDATELLDGWVAGEFLAQLA